MIETQFESWQESPPPALHATSSPNLLLALREIERRWPWFDNLGCFGRRPVRGGTLPSSHSYGAAIDCGYPPELDPEVGEQVVPWLVARSGELHLQAIHDYRRCRIWRAGRTNIESDACTWWWRAQRNSRITGMGQPWANHLHLEVTPGGWEDQTPIELRWQD